MSDNKTTICPACGGSGGEYPHCTICGTMKVRAQTTVSPTEISVLCAIDANLAVGGHNSGVLFGLIALGFIAEERTYVLTEAGRDIVNRHFPPEKEWWNV